MAQINADLSQVTDDDMNHEGGWTALDTGEYRVMIVSSDYKPTKAANGMRIGFEMKVVEPGIKGPKLFEYLTIQHPSADVARIARAQLKTIALAVGHPNPNYVQDTTELHSRVFVAKVVKQKADNPKFGDSQGFENKVIGYRAVAQDGAQQSAEQATDERPPAAPPVTGDPSQTPGWENGGTAADSAGAPAPGGGSIPF